MTQYNRGLGTSPIVPSTFSRDEFLTPFDALFDNVIGKAFPSLAEDFGVGFFEKNSYPKVDVIDHDDKITIEAEIPGLTKEEVSVDLEENVLTVSGLKHSHAEDTNTRYIRKELKRSSFKRSFKLGSNFNSKKIKADFNNGILLITVPKKEAATPKKVKIL
jgi:HSP20 family protein